MATKIAINGFGRIGRCILRAALSRKEDLEIVAINDLDKPSALAHLFKYDSVHRTWPGEVKATDKGIVVDGREIAVTAEKDPTALPWKSMDVDVVLECTGRFTGREGAEKHLKAGAKKVIISAPAKGPDLTIAYGINHDQYDPKKHHIVSNASCTTNCLAPIAKVLVDNFGIEEVLPVLKGKMHGLSVRVPTPNVSLVDLTVNTTKKVTAEEVIEAFRKAAATQLKGVLEFSDAQTVSVDYNGNPHSAIFDATNCFVMGDNLLKVMAWYDNEWGFSNRMVDTAKFLVSKGL
ncbi:MAG: aldehyde dehydrogenase [Myxococcaceae bacterium]|nr:MAG: aldehyde dehydrogenase [Myxococcaceae bacterium]